jgi:hypothetical protein
MIKRFTCCSYFDICADFWHCWFLMVIVLIFIWHLSQRHGSRTNVDMLKCVTFPNKQEKCSQFENVVFKEYLNVPKRFIQFSSALNFDAIWTLKKEEEILPTFGIVVTAIQYLFRRLTLLLLTYSTKKIGCVQAAFWQSKKNDFSRKCFNRWC